MKRRTHRNSPCSALTHGGRIKVMLCSEPGAAGVKRHVCDILRTINLDRFDVSFLYSLGRADSTYQHEIHAFQERGIECIEVPMVREAKPLSDLQCLLSIRRQISRLRPDVLHCHSAKAGFLGRLAARSQFKTPVTLYTPHAMPCYFSNLYLKLERLAARWTDVVIAVSNSEKQDILDWRIVKDDRIVVSSVGLEVDNSQRITIHNKVRRIGACGRICKQKNAKLFFQSLMPLLESEQDLELYWIGDFSGDDESDWVRKHIASSRHQDRITITGWIDNVSEHMKTLDLFCMFSAYESFGFVTADAMLMGIPVVGLDKTGTRDLVRDGETGYIVADDPQSIAGHIARIMSDAESRSLVAARAHQYIKEYFGLRSCLEKLFSLYENAARNQGQMILQPSDEALSPLLRE